MSQAHWSERLLEFDQVREILLGYCGSELGRRRVSTLSPSTELQWIARQQELADEVRRFLQAGGNFEFHGVTDSRELLKKARIAGATLEIDELRAALLLADRADEWRAIALNPPASLEGGWPAVRELSEQLTDFTLLLRFFRGKILPDGTLDDRASPELARVRREVERQKRESERAAERRGQVGSGDRSERIRTYNFPQGRVSDHRINLTLYKLPQIIEGESLGEIIDALVTEHQAAVLAAEGQPS